MRGKEGGKKEGYVEESAPTCCWWGWKVGKPPWQTACKFFKELRREIVHTNTTHPLGVGLCVPLGAGLCVPLAGLVVMEDVGPLGQEVVD